MVDISFCPLDGVNLEKHIPDAHLVVQATSVGMYPNIDEAISFPFHLLTHDHLVYDLVYNPPKTKFLQQAEKQNAKIQNGLMMLAAQAVKSLGIWGFTIEVREVIAALEELEN